MPIPDEKARAWTRPEDYWPGRRPARVGRPAKNRRRSQGYGGDPLDGGRPSLTTWPFALMMVGFAILTVAIMVMGWPGNCARPPAPQPEPTTVEIGTAPKGWIEGS